ncbi:MAG TPA: M48 family metallopeptidase [Burkholderiales bacterium]|nr:M48 family metallopeptidase [Burkholderiales bacterium]
MPKLLACGLLLVALGACAPVTLRPELDPKVTEAEKEAQREIALREQLRRQERADRVAFRLLTAAAELCGEKKAPLAGLKVLSADHYRNEWRATASRLYGLERGAVVAYVLPHSPAADAGLQAGDVLTEIEGRALRPEAGLGRVLAEALANMVPGKAHGVRYVRAGETRSTTLSPVAACAYPVLVAADSTVNAFADGRRIVVTSGMMRFAETDAELALVIGHELAHNVMGHVEKKMGNSLIGLLIGAVVSAASGVDVTRLGADLGALVYSKEFEAEADYVGLYYAARAGYPVDHAAHFWRRMAVEHPKAIGHGATHPDTASRFVALDATAREIAARRSAGEPLVPRTKGAAAAEGKTSGP